MIEQSEDMDSDAEDKALEEGLRRLVTSDTFTFTRTKSVEECMLDRIAELKGSLFQRLSSVSSTISSTAK